VLSTVITPAARFGVSAVPTNEEMQRTFPRSNGKRMIRWAASYMGLSRGDALCFCRLCDLSDCLHMFTSKHAT
jgi:hypothetical protein